MLLLQLAVAVAVVVVDIAVVAVVGVVAVVVVAAVVVAVVAAVMIVYVYIVNVCFSEGDVIKSWRLARFLLSPGGWRDSACFVWFYHTATAEDNPTN